jgi:hypothetical protein
LLLCLADHGVAQEAKQVTFMGKVLDDLGRPVTGAKVTAYEMLSDGIAGNILLRPTREMTTAEDGAFVFATTPKPKRGVFFECEIVAVKPDLALGWTEWNMREDAKSDIKLGSPGRLGGVIVDEAGKPVAGAEVRANLRRTVKTADGKENRQWLPGVAPLQELGTRTDSRGSFSLGNLPADVGVDLLVTAEGRATTYTYQLASAQPAFKVGQTDAEVTLPAEARIDGKILDPDTGEGVAETKFAVVATSSGLFYYRFVHTTNDDGTFSAGGLQTGRYLLRGDELPNTYVGVKSGQTAKVTIRVNKPYYVRILLEDSSPAVVKPEPWPGAETKISFVEEGGDSESVVDIDEEGLLEVYLSREQYQKARSGKAWFEVLIPYRDRRAYYHEDVFVRDLLATDKAKAGIAKIRGLRVEPSSLVGKHLPELKAFGTVPLPESTENNRVLVCFWDMQQRPSRNCLRKLSARAQELQARHVIVVVVQASKVDESTLSGWVRTNNITFAVGMVQGDVEKTRLSWGIKSLPWLILTDPKHVVLSEGFSLAELDEQLRADN